MTNLQFQLAPDVRVLVLDDEAVVFNPFTWETHVLNAAATLVIERVQGGACGSADIERLLANALDESESAQASEHAARVLKELTALRLLETRAEPSDADR